MSHLLLSWKEKSFRPLKWCFNDIQSVTVQRNPALSKEKCDVPFHLLFLCFFFTQSETSASLRTSCFTYFHKVTIFADNDFSHPKTICLDERQGLISLHFPHFVCFLWLGSSRCSKQHFWIKYVILTACSGTAGQASCSARHQEEPLLRAHQTPWRAGGGAHLVLPVSSGGLSGCAADSLHKWSGAPPFWSPPPFLFITLQPGAPASPCGLDWKLHNQRLFIFTAVPGLPRW